MTWLLCISLALTFWRWLWYARLFSLSFWFSSCISDFFPRQSSQVQYVLLHYCYCCTQHAVSSSFCSWAFSISTLLFPPLSLSTSPPSLFRSFPSIKFIHWIVKSLNSNKRCCAFACDYHERIRYRNKNGKALKIVVGMTSKMLKHTISHLHWAHMCVHAHIHIVVVHYFSHSLTHSLTLRTDTTTTNTAAAVVLWQRRQRRR